MRILSLLAISALVIGATSSYGDDLLGKGGKGGGNSSPPVKSGGGGSGGGQSQPPVRGGGGSSGGGQSQPPVRGGGGSSGGGQSQPPVRGGGSSGGGNSGGSSGGGGGLGRGGGGGNNNGNDSGSGRSNGGNNQGSQPPVQRGGSQSSGGGVLLGGSRNNGGSQDIIGRDRTESSRSGRVTYGSNGNLNGGSRGNYNIPEAPRVGGADAITREANREGNHISRNLGNYRQGYYQYNRGWDDNCFYYPYYRFDYSQNCYPSPWYYYPNLPGYVSYVRIQVGNFTFGWSQGSSYRWQYRDDSFDWDNGWNNGRYNDRDRSSNRELDNAIDDIYDSFHRRNMRYIGGLIPSRGSVLIEVDNSASYRIGSDDFYDLMSDLIEGTYTTNYRVRNIRTWRGGATIEADHEYRDPWGRIQRSCHLYGLEETGRGYEIVAFRTQQRW